MPITSVSDPVRRFFGEVVNGHDLDPLPGLLAPGFTNVGLLPTPLDAAGFRAGCEAFLAAFPDLSLDVEQLIEDGDTVATRGVWRGTHQGEFLGVPATGRRVEARYVDFWRIADGEVAGNWVTMDLLGVLQQLGAAPAAAAGLDLAATARAMYAAWNARDFDREVAATTEDVDWTVVPLGARFRGHDGYRRFAETWATAFPDGHADVRSVTASGQRVVVEFVGRGTHTGPLPAPDGSILAPTGRPVEIALVDVFEFGPDGRVSAGREYFDLAGMMAQLGAGAMAAAGR
ncbi:MAG TPA: ester cyclase family protein [Longimicrobiales bacterium]|nr:ester cyclase family protein [Longimicrobiales bacterium]